MVILNNLSSGSRDSSVALHWSLLHSLSRRVTDRCRRLTSAFRAVSLVTCYRLRSRFFRRTSFGIPAVIGGRESSRRRHFGVYAAIACRTAPETFSRHVLIAIPLSNYGSNGMRSTK
jgi:hypothetical protein